MSYEDFEKHETKLPIGERIKALGAGKAAGSTPAPPAAAVTPAAGKGGGIQSFLLIGILAVLVVIAAFLGFIAFRKKP
jgi:hypothetical protein